VGKTTPVQQVTKVELLLNLKTAEALGITVGLMSSNSHRMSAYGTKRT